MQWQREEEEEERRIALLGSERTGGREEYEWERR